MCRAHSLLPLSFGALVFHLRPNNHIYAQKTLKTAMLETCKLHHHASLHVKILLVFVVLKANDCEKLRRAIQCLLATKESGSSVIFCWIPGCFEWMEYLLSQFQGSLNYGTHFEGIKQAQIYGNFQGFPLNNWCIVWGPWCHFHWPLRPLRQYWGPWGRSNGSTMCLP